MLHCKNTGANPNVSIPLRMNAMSFSTEPHIVSTYDERLAELRRLVAEMGALATTQLDAAALALLGQDAGLAARWPHGERRIDALDTEVERALLFLLALRAPVASDLRLVLTLGDAARHLERIGDESGKLAAATVAIGSSNCPRSLIETAVRPLHAQVARMLDLALAALATVDAAAAEVLVTADAALDALYHERLAALVAWMAEHPRGIGAGMQLASALKALERIGDHARDIGLKIANCAHGRVPVVTAG